MPDFTVDVKAFISVVVTAPDSDAARRAAEQLVEDLSPDPNFIAGYNQGADVKICPLGTGRFDIDGESDVA